MSRNNRFRVAAFAALAVVAAGCDTGTDPDVVEAFDAEAALEDMQALEASFGTDELAGFAALGGRTPFGPSPAGIDVIANLGAPSAADGGQAWAKDLASRLIRAHDELNDGPMAGPCVIRMTVRDNAPGHRSVRIHIRTGRHAVESFRPDFHPLFR